MIAPTPASTCRDCRFFIGESGALEHALPGFNILGSAYGSVRAGTGICGHRGIFITAVPACPDFLPHATGSLIQFPQCVPPHALE